MFYIKYLKHSSLLPIWKKKSSLYCFFNVKKIHSIYYFSNKNFKIISSTFCSLKLMVYQIKLTDGIENLQLKLRSDIN